MDSSEESVGRVLQKQEAMAVARHVGEPGEWAQGSWRNGKVFWGWTQQGGQRGHWGQRGSWKAERPQDLQRL